MQIGRECFGWVLLHILSALPRPAGRFVARVSAQLIWRTNGRLRRVTERNLAICFPSWPREKRFSVARNSLYEMSLNIVSVARCWVRDPQELEDEISGGVGLEFLNDALAGNRGTLVLLPHLGNWELVNLILCKKYQITALYQQPKSAAFSGLIRRCRQRLGAKLVPIGTPGLRAIVKALRSDEMVMLLPDQVPSPNSGEFAPFFGVPTLTMTLATNLIRRTGAKAVFAYARRRSDGRHELVFEPANETIYDSDSSVALRALNESIERGVLHCPAQYQWTYKRFKFFPGLRKRDYDTDN